MLASVVHRRVVAGGARVAASTRRLSSGPTRASNPTAAAAATSARPAAPTLNRAPPTSQPSNAFAAGSGPPPPVNGAGGAAGEEAGQKSSGSGRRVLLLSLLLLAGATAHEPTREAIIAAMPPQVQEWYRDNKHKLMGATGNSKTADSSSKPVERPSTPAAPAVAASVPPSTTAAAVEKRSTPSVPAPPTLLQATRDPVVAARMDEALGATTSSKKDSALADAPMPVAPAAPSTPSPAPARTVTIDAPKPSSAAPAAPAAAATPDPSRPRARAAIRAERLEALRKAAESKPAPTPTPAAPALPPHQSRELELLLRELRDQQLSLPRFLAEAERSLAASVVAAGHEELERGLERMRLLIAEQKRTFGRLVERQDRSLQHAHWKTQREAIARFERELAFKQENSWRARLRAALEEQNDAMSAVADEQLQSEEKQLTGNYTWQVSRLRNARDALESGTLKTLRENLKAARHRELRSAQSHRLSFALLSLGDSLDRSHRAFDAAWKVILEVAQNDGTLAAAVANVDPSIVRSGVYSAGDLRRAWSVLSSELKRATFLPTRSDAWSVPMEALARVASLLTLEEAGDVLLPVTHSAALPLFPRSRDVDLSAQSADYAHYVNAATYLAANSLDLALAELDAMQPARRAIVADFIRELRKTVQAQQAMKVVRMRVLARHQEAMQ